MLLYCPLTCLLHNNICFMCIMAFFLCLFKNLSLSLFFIYLLMIWCDFLHIFSSWSSLNFLNIWFYSIQEIWGIFGHYLFHSHLCFPINSSESLITNVLEQFNIVPQVNSALFFFPVFCLVFYFIYFSIAIYSI